MINRVNHPNILRFGQVKFQIFVPLDLNDIKPIGILRRISVKQVLIQRDQFMNDVLVQDTDTQIAQRTLLKTLEAITSISHETVQCHSVHSVHCDVFAINQYRCLVYSFERLFA
jgi:hypothetical protein